MMNGNEIPEEIETRMFIKRVEPMPDRIVGHLTAEELEEFDEKDRPVLLAISKLEQVEKLRWDRVVVFMEQARMAESHWIRKLDKSERLVRRIFWTLFSSAAAAFAMWIFKV